MARNLAFAAAAVILAAGVVWSMRPAEHEAVALLRVAKHVPGVFARVAPSSDEDFAIFKRTQVQLLKSGLVLRSALGEPEIAELPTVRDRQDHAVDWLNQHLAVEFPQDAEIMRVSLRGGRPDDLTKIVDAIVNEYLKEIVLAVREQGLEQENKLEKKYAEIATEFARQSEALHTLEQLSRSNTTEAAQIERRLAEENLSEAISTRNYLKRQLLENELKINLMKVTAESSVPETRTAEPAATAPAAPAQAIAQDEEVTLGALEKQQRFLNDKLNEANDRIQDATKEFDHLELYSSNVAAKRQELAALQQIMTQLKGELDRAQLDRLAQERVTRLDDATLLSRGPDRGRRLAAAAAASLLVVVLGLAVGRRRTE